MIYSIFAISVIVSQAHAAMVTMDVETDLSTLNYSYGPSRTDAAITELQYIDTFTISEGDSLILNLSFANSERLSILTNNPNYNQSIGVYFYYNGEYTGGSTYYRYSYILFEDVEGNLNDYTEPFYVYGGSPDLWYYADFTDSEFSFSGFNTQTHYYRTDNPFTANQVRLRFTTNNAGGVIDRIPSSVPIPGAVCLLGSGLVGLVGIRKKMKR
jgi:hypothetical protein